ncbi:MAG TPA: alpha-glucan family phosphorylase, partial [Reyranella sp.]|nr:alpha-glucan family phosphorylase [Reyranella sp.]
MSPLDPFLAHSRIAYLTMEIALDPLIHTYAGGLGVLAGDTARSCADLGLPIVFVTLASRQGYLRQELGPDGVQFDHPDPWDLEARTTPLDAAVAVQIEGRPVWIRPWLHVHKSSSGGAVPTIFLDTHLAANEPQDRTITDRLYGGDATLRLKQEVVLGIGGERILRALGLEIETYHLNEGHAALLPLALLRRHPRGSNRPSEGPMSYDLDAVRECCIFTTHTPVEAGHDRFPYELVKQVLGSFIEHDQLRHLAGRDALNMTRLALNLSDWVNGVAVRHAETTRHMFPGYRIHAVTNGVHAPTWTHPLFRTLFDEVAPDWVHDPDTLIRADRLPDAKVWAAHERAKQGLIDEAKRRCGTNLRPDLPILAFARRMTGYKRPDLLFSDLERLRAIAARHPFQIVLAGKAHPNDKDGKAAIKRIHGHARALAKTVPIAFLPGYDMDVAKLLVTGADIWLNNPVPPLEASGTSGMKA